MNNSEPKKRGRPRKHKTNEQAYHEYMSLAEDAFRKSKITNDAKELRTLALTVRYAATYAQGEAEAILESKGWVKPVLEKNFEV